MKKFLAIAIVAAMGLAVLTGCSKTTEEVKETVSEAVEEKVEEVKEAVEEKVEEVSEAVEEKV